MASKQTNTLKFFYALGAGAAAATAVYLYQRKKGAKHNQNLEGSTEELLDYFGLLSHESKDDEHQRLLAEIRKDSSKIPSFNPDCYRNLSCEFGMIRLPAALAFACFTFLDFRTVLVAQRVARKWRSFCGVFKYDRNFILQCAVRGFDSERTEYRGRCWRLICRSDEIAAASTRTYQSLWSVPPTQAQDINKDVSRTLLHVPFFPTEQEAEKALRHTLFAYANHDKTVGYCQGQNFIAGFLLSHLPEEQAYWAFWSVMAAPLYKMRELFLPGLTGLMVFRHQFQWLFEAYIPDLHAHFKRHDIYPDIFTDWFMTCFTGRPFPRLLTCRIWDFLYADGMPAIHRCALAILYLCKDDLMTLDFESIIHYIKQLPHKGRLNPDLVMRTALSFDVRDSLLDTLQRHYERHQKNSGLSLDR